MGRDFAVQRMELLEKCRFLAFNAIFGFGGKLRLFARCCVSSDGRGNVKAVTLTSCDCHQSSIVQIQFTQRFRSDLVNFRDRHRALLEFQEVSATERDLIDVSGRSSRPAAAARSCEFTILRLSVKVELTKGWNFVARTRN